MLVELWRSGAVSCAAVHHWDAHSYEIRITDNERITLTGWFNNSQDAARFALERW
jgi:hypothetical protein